MMLIPQNSLQPGQQLNGFQVKAVVPLKDLQMVAYQIEHLATGAKMLNLYNDDAENLFSVSFPTPPPDDSGVPHILEHSVLSGSHKYPLRDPFFEMLKMSPATFINAMTGYDCTYYPVSSKLKQDLFNLAEVYFDAVFHPLLSENTFKREGHHLAPVEPHNPLGALKVNGIVYNEMKGAFSDPETLIDTLVTRSLLPDTIYARESGGDPQFIPELTYKDFREFHRTYYHPSNAYFLCYGNIAPQEYLQFLAPKLERFESQEIPQLISRQPHWRQPLVTEDSYPISEQESEREKTYLVVNWLIGDSTDADEWMALYVLSKILLGNEAAPLKKAIVNAQLGLDLLPDYGVQAVGWEAIFSVGIKGSEPERAQDFCELVVSTLEQIAAQKIAPTLVEAAFQQTSYYYQEISRMYPLRLMLRVLQTWIYGGEPLRFLKMREYLQQCQQRYAANPNFFNQLIREKLLHNPHRLTLVLKPNRNWQQQTDQALDERLAQLRSQLSSAQLSQIAREAVALEAEAGKANSPEAVAQLPQLKLTALPLQPEHIPTMETHLDGGVQLLRNQLFSNGINYLHLDFALQGLPRDLWVYLPAYMEALQKLGAAGMNYEQIAHRIASTTGGLKFECQFQTHAQNPSQSLTSLRVTLKTLDEQIEEALSLLQDLLFAVEPRAQERLRDVIVQTMAKYSSDLVYHGLNTAWLRAEAALTPEAYLEELIEGLPQLELTQQLSRRFEELGPELMTKIETIRDFVSSQPLIASFTGSDSAYELVRTTLTHWGTQQQATSVSPVKIDFTPNPQLREGLAGPVQIAYCVQSYPAPHFSEATAPFLTLGAHLLGLGYLFSEIRLKGNAYGAGCRYDSLGQTLSFYSYRDPHINQTLEVFDSIAKYIQTVEWRQEDIERAIIATTQQDSPVLRPELATSLALNRYLTGQTAMVREQRYESTLKATVQPVKQAFLDVLARGSEDLAVCVMSSREKLESANRQMRGKPLVIRDILGREI